MLAVKWLAYSLTHSSVIFSDAAESVVHIIAVWFAWFALRISHKPPDKEHHYGHDKMSFISAGIEGALICIAAIVIVGTATSMLFYGVELANVDIGIGITAGAGLVNGLLGWYLTSVGKRNDSVLVVANGKHVLTDAWTSAGAVLGLLFAWFSGWLWLDPVIAILFALNILREGVNLVYGSVSGLMDKADANAEARIRTILGDYCTEYNLSYHRLRLRNSGATLHVDYHLIVSDSLTMREAHELATHMEERIKSSFETVVTVLTHLEGESHPDGHE